MVPMPHKIEKQTISYAKVAKVVDVRALKKSMWKEMCSELHNIQTEQLATKDSKDFDQQMMKSARSFQDVINAMPNYIPASKLKDISLSYYFICLLHLANEKNLHLQQTGLTDLIIRPSTTPNIN
jgi:condensin complex subunit 2